MASAAAVAGALALLGCGGGQPAPISPDPQAIEQALQQRLTSELLRTLLANQREPATAERTRAIQQMRVAIYAQGQACTEIDSDATLEITRGSARTSAATAEFFARQLASTRPWSPTQFRDEFNTHRAEEWRLATQTSSCSAAWNAELNQRMGRAVGAAYDDAMERLRWDLILS